MNIFKQYYVADMIDNDGKVTGSIVVGTWWFKSPVWVHSNLKNHLSSDKHISNFRRL